MCSECVPQRAAGSTLWPPVHTATLARLPQPSPKPGERSCFPRAGSGKKWALGWVGGSGGGRIEESKESCVPSSSRYPDEHPTRGRPPKARSTCLFGVRRSENPVPHWARAPTAGSKPENQNADWRAASRICVAEKPPSRPGPRPTRLLADPAVAPPRGEEDYDWETAGRGRALTCRETQEKGGWRRQQRGRSRWGVNDGRSVKHRWTFLPVPPSSEPGRDPGPAEPAGQWAGSPQALRRLL